MTKIEQVAAAMALATNGGKWDDGHYCEDHKALWMKRAKAAIEAMREPTERMIFAGTSVTSVWRDIKGSQLTVNREKMRMRYGAMIAAALQEKPDV